MRPDFSWVVQAARIPESILIKLNLPYDHKRCEINFIIAARFAIYAPACMMSQPSFWYRTDATHKSPCRCITMIYLLISVTAGEGSAKGTLFAQSNYESEKEGDYMLDNKFKCGFCNEQLESGAEPKVHKDSNGYYINTLSENVKVYFDDYYQFLSKVYERCQEEMDDIEAKMSGTPKNHVETLSYLRARKIIIQITQKTARSFYTDGTNFGVIMTPWCFGTVILEKVEIYRERLARGDVDDSNIPEFAYYVIRYMDEIYKRVLLDIFDFPTDAFKMRWQYSELLKRYSKVLSNITTSLNSVLTMIKNYGT